MATAKLSLHGIDDVEAFAGAIVQRSWLELSHHDREDLHAYLVAECWRLSLRYERGDPQFPPRFSVYATPILRNRVVDWQRKRFGRTRWTFKDQVIERKLPQLVSLDADDPERDRLVDRLGAGAGDSAADWDEALGGLVGERDRTRAWDYETLGLCPPRRVA